MKVIVQNLAIEYSDTGDGPLVLFLHGWGSDSSAFDQFKRELHGNYRIVTVDLPGFGGSQQPKDDWHIADYARFTADFIQKAAGQTPVYALFGHSFGGRVILKAVSGGLIAPKKIVLMGAAGIKPKKTFKQHLYKLIAKAGKAVVSLPGLRRFSEPLRRRLYGAIGSTDYLNSGTMQNIFLNTINEDLRDDARQISAPALLIWGVDDTETPIGQGRELQALLQQAELREIPSAGHYVFIDQPQIVLNEIKKFLDD